MTIEQIQKWMERLDVNEAQLAAACQPRVSRQYVWRIVRGERSLSSELAGRMEVALRELAGQRRRLGRRWDAAAAEMGVE